MAIGQHILIPRISAWILLALSLVLCGGCMTYVLYDGPNRPTGELGIIKLGVIRDVDGGDLSYLKNHKLAVVPGLHTLRLVGSVKLNSGELSRSDHTFDVVVEPGHVYEGFVSRGKSRKWKTNVVAVVDMTMNKVVARYPPLSSARSKAGSASGPHSPRPKAE